MSRQGARVLLVICCLIAGAAAFQSFRFGQVQHDERLRVLSVERNAGALLVTLADLRGAQMAYLATGQGPDFWMRRADELAGRLQSGIADLRGGTAAAAQHHLATASSAVTNLMQLDGRARQAIEAEQRFLASDLIFADGVTGTQQIVEALDAARRAEVAVVEATLSRDRAMQLALFPASLVLVLIAAWIAGNARRPASAPRSEAEELAQMLRDLPPPVKAPGVAVPATPPIAIAPSRTVIAPPVATVAPEPLTAAAVAPSLSLVDTAELCVDLARVIDARDMPLLLQRAARTLDATGIIVWVVDTAGAVLTPALAHGYPDRVLAKLGPLDVNADNVTSLSFRSMRPQSMPSTGGKGSSSAIAVPLITTEGCNGVFAAEVPVAGDECIAVARILAAQLSTLLSPVEPAAQKVADA